jgi:O-antigen/teichoic acid export membrane protein
MSAVRNILLMGFSTAVRLAFGMLTFVVMARLLGPEPFGTVMIWLSIATLLSLVANFGLTPYLLREIATAPERTQRIMREVLSAKLLLSAVVLFASVCALPFIPASSRTVFLLLLGALLADSLTEFLNVGFRASNRFAGETRLATVAAALQFAIVSVAVWITPDELAAAAGFILSRLLVLVITWSAQRRYFATLKPGNLAVGVERIRETLGYAVDFGMQSLFGQIDSLVLNHFVGPASVGVYQAGMRLFAGGAQAASVLANVFLPRAAAAAKSSVTFERETRSVQFAFLSVGLCFGLALTVFSRQIADVFFGSRFNALDAILPWFGILFFVRFFASSWGVVLTGAGLQNFRAWMNAMQWAVVLSLSWRWIPQFGIVGWLMALVSGNLLLGVAYFARAARIVRPGLRTAAFAALAAVAFIPFVHLPLPATPS